MRHGNLGQTTTSLSDESNVGPTGSRQRKPASMPRKKHSQRNRTKPKPPTWEALRREEYEWELELRKKYPDEEEFVKGFYHAHCSDEVKYWFRKLEDRDVGDQNGPNRFLIEYLSANHQITPYGFPFLSEHDLLSILQRDYLDRREFGSAFLTEEKRPADPTTLPLVSLGDRNYQFGKAVLVVDDVEETVLQAFFKDASSEARWVALSYNEVRRRTNIENAPRILKRFLTKNPQLGSTIKCPGKRGYGGLKVYLAQSNSDRSISR